MRRGWDKGERGGEAIEKNRGVQSGTQTASEIRFAEPGRSPDPLRRWPSRHGFVVLGRPKIRSFKASGSSQRTTGLGRARSAHTKPVTCPSFILFPSLYSFSELRNVSRSYVAFNDGFRGGVYSWYLAFPFSF